MTVDRLSRFVIAWAFGPRTAALAEAVVPMTRQRTAARAGIAWVTDGWDPYAATLFDVYCDPVGEPLPIGTGTCVVLRRTPGVRLTQAVKHRRGRRLISVEVRATIGSAVDPPHTVHVERFNGVLRDRLACLTRKTHAFAKDAAHWDAAVTLALFEQNWLRPHPALRQPRAAPDPCRRYQHRTPAMALGLTDHRWSVVEFLTRQVPHHTRG
jgi:IS1 family transposase